ncbi:MAG: RHS repeat protein, partial [Acidobacteriaceae bacterium]|nr:RHS repeat protein [Acidobacteriaceae bacterium]
TTVTDPQANQTVMQFQGIYETQRKVYQGSTSGTLLKTIDTCYNGSASPCMGTAVSLPITQVSSTTTLPGTTPRLSKVVNDYNSYGLNTETDEYDWGQSAVGTLVRKTVTTYSTSLGNIVDHPSTVQVYDHGNLISTTTYSYDGGSVVGTSGTPQHVAVSGARGNLTSLQVAATGSGTRTSSYTHYDTGNVYQATDVNGAVTTYTYGNCGNSFVSSISMPLSLSTSQTWNCTGAVQTSTTDANGKTSSVSFADANYWRPTSTTDATGAVTTMTYATSPIASESTLNFNGTTSTADTRATLDGLGRTHVTQRRQAQGSSSYDSVETDYDTLGRASRVTVPYTGTAGQTNSSAAGVVTTYDPLSRPLTVTDGGGGSTTYSYNQNDVLITVGPAPSGESTKRRQLEYDALGRVTSVCELTTAAGAGTCGQTVAQTGYWTKYTYDANNDLLTVAQNAQSGTAQSRSYQYDGLGRMTSETNPENGTVSYVYDSDSTCGTSTGDLVKRVDAMGNVKCFSYDALHRNTALTYPSGPYAAATPAKTFVYDAATVDGVAMANAKGGLAEAYTGPGSAKITDLGFSYSARGEVTDTYELTPHSAGYYHVSASYWANGVLDTFSTNVSGLPTWTYTPDGEGRVYSVAASSGQSPVTSTTYSTFGVTGVTFGSGDSDNFEYDPYTGRETQYQFVVNGTAATSNLTWNANGTLLQLAVNDPFNGSDTQTCTNSYDDLMRLTTNNCGSVWSQTFSYDPFGNIAKSGSVSFQPTYNSQTNQYSTLPGGTPAYDANGNVTNDTFHNYLLDVDGKNTQADGSTTLTYDALGRWVERGTSYNGSMYYSQALYSPMGNYVAIMSGQSLRAAYLPLPSGAVAYYSLALDSYWHADWLGTTTRLISTPSRTVKGGKAFAPFGDQYA